MNINSKMTKNSLKQLEKISDKKLTLGTFLLAIRQGDEVSQVDFAATLGISKQQLCDIEHGRKLVSPRLATSYADKLGYSREQFVRLSLQEMVDKDNLDFAVDVVSKKGRVHGHDLAYA